MFAIPVSHPDHDQQFWLVVSHPGKSQPLWYLRTSEPIGNELDACDIVFAYARRWQIEDFHKALKTGCWMEHHNGQSMHAQWEFLAVLAPIALRLLIIRQTA
ncbi:transposase [Ktedonobacter robiniae]|uniref:Transposase IS4-like domain-containing protein n=1 Tax=Ktedonobacter robiniae TaxID=2778365 RepID=A0ABQ3UQ41_9CHLR|nr:transposase [Ktedonobacter robiniae]GHO54851.1 hypothetical protein KSB_33260 [Ktedonobacter robiniae]